MGTHPIFESDFDCLTDFENARSSRHPSNRAPSTLGHSTSPKLDWTTSAGPVAANMGNPMAMVFYAVLAGNALVSLGSLTGMWNVKDIAGQFQRSMSGTGAAYDAVVPTTVEHFDYKGFNPKPKLFAAFQFPNV